MPRLIFNWCTFFRRVTAPWSRGWAKHQVSTNQNSKNSGAKLQGELYVILFDGSLPSLPEQAFKNENITFDEILPWENPFDLIAKNEPSDNDELLSTRSGRPNLKYSTVILKNSHRARKKPWDGVKLTSN